MGNTAEKVLETVNPVESVAKAFRSEVLHADLVAAIQAKEDRKSNVIGIHGHPLIIDESVKEPEQGELLLEQPLEASQEPTQSDSSVKATDEPEIKETPVAPSNEAVGPIPLIEETDDKRSPLTLPSISHQPRKPFFKPLLAKAKTWLRLAGKATSAMATITGIAIVGFLVSLFFIGWYSTRAVLYATAWLIHSHVDFFMKGWNYNPMLDSD